QHVSTLTSPLSLHDALPIFPGEPRDLAVILMGVIVPVAHHHIWRHARFEVLEALLQFGTLVGEEAVAELAELDGGVGAAAQELLDRKSTRLNSSHGSISYAV